MGPSGDPSTYKKLVKRERHQDRKEAREPSSTKGHETKKKDAERARDPWDS